MGVHEDKKQIREELVTRLLSGAGKASPEARTQAFRNADVVEPLRTLIAAVATGGGQLRDDEIEGAKAAGFTEDQIFELVIAAAVGAASRGCQSGLDALDRARSTEGSG